MSSCASWSWSERKKKKKLSLCNQSCGNNNIIVKFDSTSWTITLLALLPALFLIRVIFRQIVGYCVKDLGAFGIIILCCCDVAEVVHKGLMRCLLRCSCFNASDSDTISEASSLPSYTVSLQHLLSSLFLFISHFSLHVLTKYLYMTTGNLMILFNLYMALLPLYHNFECFIITVAQ